MKSTKIGGISMKNTYESGVTKNFKKEIMTLIFQKGLTGKLSVGHGFFIIRAEEYSETDEAIVDRITVEDEEFLILSNFG